MSFEREQNGLDPLQASALELANTLRSSTASEVQAALRAENEAGSTLVEERLGSLEHRLGALEQLVNRVAAEPVMAIPCCEEPAPRQPLWKRFATIFGNGRNGH
ncbi:MAG TPA: hypothetical protein VE988_00505 [Gemmataceae bacterium]|nr:hypothetical protein [Gemmataceae bacterium]